MPILVQGIMVNLVLASFQPILPRFVKVDRLPGTGYVYLCKDDSGALSVVKIVLGPYPTDLHRELEAKDLAPNLLSSPQLFPGGYTMIHTAYLDPSEGWELLSSAHGNLDESSFSSAIETFQSCLGGKAVHGDLRPNNILCR